VCIANVTAVIYNPHGTAVELKWRCCEYNSHGTDVTSIKWHDCHMYEGQSKSSWKSSADGE